MRTVFSLLVLSVLAAPLSSLADGSIAINGRAGVAKPWGDFAKDEPMSDGLSWGFPLQADLQFRFTKQLSLGAYVRYAPLLLSDDAKTACDALGASCSAADIGLGGVVEYRFSERMEGGGWVGANVGYELLRSDTGVGTAKATFTSTGLEAGAQVGYDFELGGLTIGPFLQAGAGQFTKEKVKSGGQTTTSSIGDKAIHGWAGVGLRFTLLL
jgi:outer membrane autotransporter protein